MKKLINTQQLLTVIGAILIFSVFIAFIIAGYNLAVGNFHQSVYL